MSNNYSKYYKKEKVDTAKDKKKEKVEFARDTTDIAEAQKVDKSIFSILLIILAILPLLTRTKVIDFSSPLVTNSSVGSGLVGDVFTYYKFIFLVIATSILLILFLYRTFGIGIPIKKCYINILLAILSIFVTLSALFAPYKSLALVGMYNRHEGAITYLCYFTLFFIAANLTYTKKMLYNIIYALYPIVIVNALLGLLGFYGVDLIKSSFVRAILLPKGITEDMIGAGSQFITTINHGNYVSGISVVLIVIPMMMFILDKNKVRQTVNGILAILSFAMLLSSLSRSGFLTFVIILPIIAILLIHSNEKIKHYGKFAIQLVLFGVIFVVMASHNPKVWDESMSMFVKDNPFLSQESASIHTDNGKGIYKGLREESDINVDEISNLAIDKGINGVFGVNKVYADSLDVSGDNNMINFQLPVLPEQKWGAGTGRIYIWEKGLELIAKKPILGYGLDTYTYFFPQYDPQKIGQLNDYKTIVDKPHNFYINFAFGTGVIGLIALLVLILIPILKGIKLSFVKALDNEKQLFITSLFVGSVAYTLQGLFNDSIIGTAPIFWILLGVFWTLINKEMTED